MNEHYNLEWTFSPPDYFEDPVDLKCPHGTIHVENGRAEMVLPPNISPEDHGLRNQLHEELELRFLAAQLFAHKSYSLTKPKLVKVLPDGRREVSVFLEAAVTVMTSATADFVVQDAAGRITKDTRAERIRARVELAQLAAAHGADPVANTILRSYSAAVNDPKNELVHLYEIRDAVSRQFGGENAARTALGISSGQWSRLGRLANDEPLSQGRHRGKQLGALRDATTAELKEAREIARRMVEAYLRQLGRGGGQQ